MGISLFYCITFIRLEEDFLYKMREISVLKRNRSVSPVIAMILVIAIAVAGGASVSVVMNNAISTNTSLNPASQLNKSANSISEVVGTIIQVFSDPNPQRSKDVVGLRVQVDNKLTSPVYVHGIDVYIGNTRLDDFAPWVIQGAINAYKVNSQGSLFRLGDTFGGYKQSSGNASYDIGLSVADYGVTFARIPFNTSLFYAKIKISSAPGTIDRTVLTKVVSLKDFFAPVTYRIAILTFNDITDNAFERLEKSITDKRFRYITQTKGITFQFDPNKDVYDLGKITLNTTYMAETYNLVLVSTWAVPKVATSALTALFDRGVPLVFFGTVSAFGNYNDIQKQIDWMTTERITGLVPLSCGTTCDGLLTTGNNGGGGGGVTATANNTYSFYSGTPAITADIQTNVMFNERVKNGAQDVGGRDVATLSANKSIDVTAYGNHTYRIYKNGVLAFNQTGVSYAIRISPQGSRVVSFAFNDLYLDKSLPKELRHEKVVPRDMVITSLKEEAKLMTNARVKVNSFQVIKNPKNPSEFRLQLTSQVVDGDINIYWGSMNYTFNLPKDLTISYANKKASYLMAQLQTYSNPTKLKTGIFNMAISSSNAYSSDVGGLTRDNNRLADYIYRLDNLTITLPVKKDGSLGWFVASGNLALKHSWGVSANWTNKIGTIGSTVLSFSYSLNQGTINFMSVAATNIVSYKSTKLKL